MELKNFFAQDLQGNVIPSPTVTVYLAKTTTLATGLEDKDGNALTNPFTGGGSGQVTFAAPDGNYDLKIEAPGRVTTMRVRFIDSTGILTDAGISIYDYETLRNYTGGAKRIYITGLLVTEKPAGICGTFQYDSTDTTSNDNGGTVIVGIGERRWKRDFTGSGDISWFGASPTASQSENALAIQKAFSSGLKKVRVPDAIYDCGNAIIYIDRNDFTLTGDGTTTVDTSTNSFTSGPVIKATIASSGYSGISIKNIGIDSKNASITEGLTITNCNDVLVENVIVLGSNENNHCCLIENVRKVTIRGFTSFGGKQGLAVKAVDFLIDGVKSYDTVTYGFTIRFSPGAPCYNGFIKNISCQTNLLAKSGGFILMNDQSGAALRDLVIDGVIVDNCNNGIYITNTGNSTKATRIKFSNIIIKNIAGYSFQTFGDVDDVSIDGIEFDNVGGTIYTNQATGATRLTVSNLKQKNAGIALISGSGHKLYNWEKSGGGGFFGQNTSSNLEYYGMDATVTPFSNITDASGTGTIAQKIQFPSDISIAANGLLYAMRYQDKRVKTFSNMLSQNSVSDLFALPNANDCVAEITINVLSDAGRHCAKFLICGTSVTKLAGNTLSEAVFSIMLSGTSVQFKYLWTVTGATYVDCIYSVYGQDA